MTSKSDKKIDSGKLGTTPALREALKLRDKLRQSVVPKEQPENTFIRTKLFGGKPYYFLVRSVRVGERVRQVNLLYLGVRPPRGWK